MQSVLDKNNALGHCLQKFERFHKQEAYREYNRFSKHQYGG